MESAGETACATYGRPVFAVVRQTVSAGASDQEAVQLIQVGAAGILHKQNSTEDLCHTIRQVAKGEVCLEDKYLGPLFRAVDRSWPRTGPKLTTRDRSRFPKAP